MALTEKQKEFAREYFSNGGNGTKAYLSIYNSNNAAVAANESSLLLKNEEIQKYLQSMNRPLEKKAISEREKKRDILWSFINDIGKSDSDRLKAMDLLNKMDAEYININKNIDDTPTNIETLDNDTLLRLTSVS